MRSVAVGPVYKSYTFTYNNDAIPHLTSIGTHVPGDNSNIQFTYHGSTSLLDPFASANFGSAVDLATMSVPGSGGLQFAMTYYSGSHEFRKITMPYGGTIEWEYGPKTLAGDRTMREVTKRTLNAADSQGDKIYTLSHNDTADLPLLAHAYTVVQDASGVADKKYVFSTTGDWTLGLLTGLQERKVAGPVTLRESTMTWQRTANLNPYITATVETMDPGQSYAQSSKVEQTLNDHGNLTERKQYGYYAPGGTPPLARTFTYAYLATSNYTSRHIWNRLLTASVVKPGGTAISLVSNNYDGYTAGSVNAVSNPSVLRQHDTANYGSGFLFRGNVTSSTKPGSTVTMVYDYTGSVLSTSDGYGHGATQTRDANRNYAVPSAMTAGSLSSSFSWNGANEMTSTTGPNGATASASYDSYLRPASRTAPNGSVTTFTYGSSVPYWTKATTGTRWTKTTVDGFGRAMTSESGTISGANSVTVSLVDTKHAPCACTPVGKLWKTSLPYAPGTAGGSKLWVEHYYDALGRTVEVRQPSAAGSTTYEYTGVVVKVIDPKGKWKKFTNDALGNLVNVQEPRPGGGTAYETNYTYSELGQLLTVTMVRPGKGAGAPATVTQTRTWVYDGNQRLSTVVHPESGTTAKPSTTFAYNPDGTVLWKMDSKEQKIGYTYDSDGRVTVAKRYYANGGEDTCAKVEYFYNSQSYDASFSQNANGRLAATATGCTYAGAGQLIEMYSYNAAGAVLKKRLRIVRGSGTVDKDVTYTYGSDGKLATVLYPGTTVPYTYSYDLMDRPVKMTGSPTLLGNTTVDLVKDVQFGVAGQLTSMKYMQWQDNGTPYFFTETKWYNSLFQMTRQETAGSGGTAADIEYGYTAPSSTLNDGRIYSRKNKQRNGASGEEVVYTYDELNRVTLASSSAGWAQSFDYDGFGNLWTANMSGNGSATPLNVTFSQTTSTNRINTSGWTYDLNGNTTAMPVPGGSASMTYDIDNRLKTWTGSPGVEEYGYLADNKRVWKKAPSGAETVYFYGVGGQKLLTYTVQTSPFALISPVENVYFGGKLIRANGVAVVHDRLGSVVARVGSSDAAAFTKHDYLPYGEEMDSATGGNVDKFGTYLRDQTTGLDYADQRYFAGTLGGRFLSADPYEASGGASEPGSWNRYPYVGGDPVNLTDRTGLYWDDCSLGGCLMAPPEDGGGVIGFGAPLLGTFLGSPPELTVPGFGSPPIGGVDGIPLPGWTDWGLPGSWGIGFQGVPLSPAQIEQLRRLAVDRAQWGAIWTAIAGAWSNIVNRRQSQDSQERDLQWAREAYRKECGHRYPGGRGREARRLGGDRSRFHDAISHQGLSREDVLQEMLRLHPCKKEEIVP